MRISPITSPIGSASNSFYVSTILGRDSHLSMFSGLSAKSNAPSIIFNGPLTPLNSTQKKPAFMPDSKNSILKKDYLKSFTPITEVPSSGRKS